MNATSVCERISQRWLKMLKESEIRFVVLDPQIDNKLMELLQLQPNWKIESADEEFVFFIRNDIAMGIA